MIKIVPLCFFVSCCLVGAVCYPLGCPLWVGPAVGAFEYGLVFLMMWAADSL